MTAFEPVTTFPEPSSTDTVIGGAMEESTVEADGWIENLILTPTAGPVASFLQLSNASAAKGIRSAMRRGRAAREQTESVTMGGGP